MDCEHTGGEVQRLGGFGACKNQGMSSALQGVLALAALEPRDAMANSTLGVGDRVLPERPLQEPIRKAA